MLSIIAFIVLILWYRYRVSHDKPVNKKIFRALLIVECMGLLVTVGMNLYRKTRSYNMLTEESIRESIIQEIEADASSGDDGNLEKNDIEEDTESTEGIGDAGESTQVTSSGESENVYDTSDDADRLTLLYDAADEIRRTFLGENEEMGEIRKDLVLKDSYLDGKVAADWYVGDTGILDKEGHVYRSSLTEPQEVYVIAYLDVDGVTYPLDFAVIVLPE